MRLLRIDKRSSFLLDIETIFVIVVRIFIYYFHDTDINSLFVIITARIISIISIIAVAVVIIVVVFVVYHGRKSSYVVDNHQQYHDHVMLM